MAIQRLEISNPKYTPENTQLVTVYSSHLQRRHDISIYNINTKANDVPIIILMHGVYGNHWVWMHLGGVHQVYESLKQKHQLGEFILVMPSDGGLHEGSAYLPTMKHGNYEQWIMDDVVNATIATTESASQNSPLYLTGLSMGGYGALRLGAKFAKQIKGISAHSSITELSQINEFTDTPLSLYQCADQNEADLLSWFKQNKSQLPPLRFDCGEEDTLFQGNLALHQALLAENISHQFDRFAGAHSWEYWHQHIEQTFRFFNSIELQN
ncbi:ATPase [Marinomonas agarivorans]|nr:ATPase [Marinomonas agarivorans]